MSRFVSKLQCEVNGGFPLVLVAPFTYESDLLGGSVTVPAGFPTDLASIPRGLWNILPPIGSYDRAAVVHDYLYRFNGLTRKQADDVLLEAMRVSGVRAVTAYVIYLGVRLGGWVPWRTYRKNASR